MIVSHYEVVRPLGKGGMGEVYAAVDLTLKRQVALKAVRANERLNDEAKARFLREAQILSQLDHPNVCRVYDYVDDTSGDWLVLELIDGTDLRQAIAGGLDRATRLRIAQQIADVLVATHAAGVVHRDLKPSNVMLTTAGEVKVLDFGLARSGIAGAVPLKAGPQDPPYVPAGRQDPHSVPPGRTDSEATHTAAGALSGSDIQTTFGSILGTPGYMSPEQAQGDVATSASDMYSYGLLLQELFTGTRPYDQSLDYWSLVEEARFGRHVPATGIDRDVAALITRLTALAPAQRPTAVDALERLQWIRGKARRRLMWAAAAALFAVAVIGATKYTIDLARERSAAIAAREEADRRREQAESLIGFMLGDLRTRLQQVGRLEVLDAVGREATKYFNAVPPGALSGEELFRRSQSMQQIGQIRQAEGDLATAVDAYRSAITFAEQAVASDPANGDWQIGLGEAHFYAAEAAHRQGKFDDALREFSAYKKVGDRLVAADPQNERFLLELSYGHGGLAAVYEATGQLLAARRELESAQRIKEGLLARQPLDAQRRRGVATGHNRLGVVLDKLGETDAALRHFLADLQIRRGFVEAEPQNYAIKTSFQVALSFVGLLHESRGELNAARRYFEELERTANEQAALDRRNAEWQRNAAVATAHMADVEFFTGATRAADARYAAALARLRAAVVAAPARTAWRQDLAEIEVGAGRSALMRGEVAQAAMHANNAEQMLGPLLERGNADIAATAADARLLAADAMAAAGHRSQALATRASALTLVPDSPASAADKRVLGVRARALAVLGRQNEAGALLKRLTELQYRHPSLRPLTNGAPATIEAR